MKKHLFFIAALSCALVAFSCSKEADLNSDVVAPGNEVENPAQPAAEPITISATLSDALTKVTFTPGTNGSGKPMLALTWDADDKLCVADASNHSSCSEFTLASGAGTNEAKFTGTPVSATSYDIWVVNADDPTNMQVQASDGDAAHIQYVAQATGITDLTADINFSEVSSVLGLQAKLPAGAAATITSVVLTASEDIFFGGKTLTLGITTPGDAGTDDILNLYATLPSGSTTIPDGTTLFVKFNSNNASHSVYTAYRELGSGLTFTSGALNNLKMNCVHTDQYAGKDDDGTSAHPYLIADKYQLIAVEDLMIAGEKKYFKLIDDISVDAGWNSLNPSPFTKQIDMEGNNKTISNLDSPLFSDFNGNAQNFTISNATINTGESNDPAGIFARTVKTAASTLSNVDITNSSLTSTKAYTGGLIGQTSQNIQVSGVDVTTTSVSGGLTGGIVGYTANTATISNCTYSGATLTANAMHAGGILGATYSGKATSISDCSVTNATLTSAFHRLGGAVGTLRAGAVIERTNVGANGNNVTITATGTAARYTGGLVGRMEGGTIQDNCNTYITLTGVKTEIGGFVGEMVTGTVTGGKSHGSVTGPGTIGGFFGIVTGATSITNNESNCSVTATSTYVGGFAGRLAGNVSVSECYHKTGKVASTLGGGTAVYLGGFAGYIGSQTEAFTGTISKCYVNSAEVDGVKYENNSAKSSGQYVGGFAGGIGSATYADNTGLVEKCGVYASSKKGGYYTGGFAGASYSKIEKCRVTGAFTVQGYGNSVGGFCGYQQGNHVKYCYTNAKPNTNNKTSVGGFIGNAKSTTVEECYSSGAITGTSNSTGGMIGSVDANVTTTKLIRWNDSNNLTIVAGESSAPSGCYVKTSSDNSFYNKASSLGWSTDGSIWNYPTDGTIPTLVGV